MVTLFRSSLTRLASLRISCEDDYHPGWTVLPRFPPEIKHLTQLTHLSLTSKASPALLAGRHLSQWLASVHILLG